MNPSRVKTLSEARKRKLSYSAQVRSSAEYSQGLPQRYGDNMMQ